MNLFLQHFMYVLLYTIVARIVYLNMHKTLTNVEPRFETYEVNSFSFVCSAFWPLTISFIILKIVFISLLKYIDLFCRYFVR